MRTRTARLRISQASLSASCQYQLGEGRHLGDYRHCRSLAVVSAFDHSPRLYLLVPALITFILTPTLSRIAVLLCLGLCFSFF